MRGGGGAIGGLLCWWGLSFSAFSQNSECQNKRTIFSVTSLRVDLRWSKQVHKGRRPSSIFSGRNEGARSGADPASWRGGVVSALPIIRRFIFIIGAPRFHPRAAVTSGQREEVVFDSISLLVGLHIYTHGLAQLGARLSTPPAPRGAAHFNKSVVSRGRQPREGLMNRRGEEGPETLESFGPPRSLVFAGAAREARRR